MQSKTLGRAQSIAKHSKELKNISKGDKLEMRVSLFYHTKFKGLLVSSKVLREFDCGQVDVVYFKNKKLVILEVKSRPELIGRRQKLRLRKTLDLLTQVLGVYGELKIIKELPK